MALFSILIETKRQLYDAEAFKLDVWVPSKPSNLPPQNIEESQLDLLTGRDIAPLIFTLGTPKKFWV